jgi:hypothetical protein
LEINLLIVAVNSFGEQKLVILFTKSFNEMFVFFYNRPSEFVYNHSKGCSFSFIISVSGINTFGVSLEIWTNSFQKQEQGLIPFY